MIRGDASDGLPGIKGIGEKGAAVIAHSFSSMKDVIEAAQGESELLPAPLRKKILADIAYAKIAEKLVHCAVDAPVPKIDFSLPKKGNLDEIYSLKEKYNLGASVDRFINALGW